MEYNNLNYVNFTQEELQDFFTAAKEGDSKAFGHLSGYVRHISYTYFLSKFNKGKIPNKDDVEDLANNVYLSFAEQYEKIENLEYWLRKVLFLTFVNWYKKNKNRRTYELDEAYYKETKEVNPGVNVDAQIVLDVLETLSEDKQKILKMRFWEQLKFAEIAENMGKSEDAVKKMFYRTIEEIKNKF